MTKRELIELFNHRELNCKTNNFIFSGVDNFKIIDDIPSKCIISTPENNINVDVAYNIKINLAEVNIKDILSYTLGLLKKWLFLDVSFDYTLDFNNKFDLIRFQRVLSDYNIISQLIFYNVEALLREEQFLFNEIYYFNSIFFNSNSFIKGDNFPTYFLSKGRILDERENYTKIKLLEDI